LTNAASGWERLMRSITAARLCSEGRGGVSEDLAFPVTMYLYDQRLAVISTREEEFALIVESRELCGMQKKLFELLWRTAV
jgi:hypothetical protein